MMSEWNLCELEDIDWGDFGKSDDHIVPNRVGELVEESLARFDACKKPRHEVENDVGKSMFSRGSATKTLLQRKEETYLPPTKDGSSFILEGTQSHASKIVLPASCDPDIADSGTALDSLDAGIPNNCVKDCSIDTNSNTYCSKDPSPETGVSTDGSKDCHFSVSDVSPEGTDISFLENEQNDGENDLIYYDWPDIGNFEDVDRMFRNWDSTFGQGHTGTGDELSWFSSSSQTIYGSEINFEPGLQSSCSELSAPNSTAEQECANTNFLPKNYRKLADPDRTCSLGYQSKEKVCDGGEEVKTTGPSQMESRDSSEGKRTKELADQKILFSDVSAPHSKQFSKKNSAILNPHLQVEYGISAPGEPLKQKVLKLENETKSSSSYNGSDHGANQLSMPQTKASEEKIQKLHLRQLADIRNKPLVQKKHHTFQHETGGDSELEDMSSIFPMVDTDASAVQESSCMTSVFSYDISVEATSFHQLEDVMHQLDDRTKLCIRDSLYRLARSAKKRHNFSHVSDCNRESSNTRGFQGEEASIKCPDVMDVETDTNAIDRSIAHLLFHKPSEPATRCADIATSLESRILLHVPITNQAAMPDEFDHQRLFSGGALWELPR